MKLSQEDIKEVHRLRGLFPKEILVKIHRSEDGGFFAHVETYPGCNTQGETFSELIEMVNDCVKTYLEISERYIPYVPSYLPSIELAQEFGAFPSLKLGGDLRLQLV